MPLIDENFLATLTLEPVCEEASPSQNKAFAKITRLAGMREYSRVELQARLERDGFEEADIAHALARALACGLIDDARFGAVLVRSRVAQGKGLRGIVEELAQHDISPESIEGWPYEFFPEEESDEHERALEFLRRKPPHAKNVQAAAFRKLVQKGYDIGIASSAAREFVRETQGLVSDF